MEFGDFNSDNVLYPFDDTPLYRKRGDRPHAADRPAPSVTDAECTIDRFWETKPLAEMSQGEWEALCDGCGRCCVVKLEDEDTGTVYPTSVSCRLLDTTSCRCTDYCNRHDRVPDCVKLDRDNVSNLGWLPATCAYRRISEGHGLDWWHPLVSGDARTVVEAGVSVSGRVLLETQVAEEDLVEFMIEWPVPKKPPVSRKRK